MKSIIRTSIVSLAAITFNVNAEILSYGGYTHDTSTDIVTGNGLEWLQWDVTVGESINSIQSQLGTLYGGGWSIASNAQMAHLFNAFDFGLTFDTDENTHQQVATGYQFPDTLAEPAYAFVMMFGDTRLAGGVPPTTDYDGNLLQAADAFFGLDLDNDNKINRAYVRDDYRIGPSGNQMFEGVASIWTDGYLNVNTGNTTGIALVRGSVVPLPPAVWLFGTGLLGLIGVARRKTCT